MASMTQNMKHTSLPPKANPLATYHCDTAPNLQVAGFYGGVSRGEDEAEIQPQITSALASLLALFVSKARLDMTSDNTSLRLDVSRQPTNR
jgi:hypothetical protein